MGKKQRKEKGEARLRELCSLAEPLGIVVRVLNSWPMHVRVYGANRVDYWPTTGKGWVFDTQSSAASYSPSEILQLAGIPGAGETSRRDGAGEDIKR